jgi:hypothetical protein
MTVNSGSESPGPPAIIEPGPEVGELPNRAMSNLKDSPAELQVEPEGGVAAADTGTTPRTMAAAFKLHSGNATSPARSARGGVTVTTL